MEYGLIGEHLGHSFSKEIHAQIADYDYELKELSKDELDSFMRSKAFKAINVTIPYKKAVIPYLDEISQRARLIGAVNTIVNKGGRLIGENTDFDGMSMLIKKMGLSLEEKKVLILGTGGTSATAMAVARSMNAADVIRVSRSKKEGTVDYEEAAQRHSDAQILINTTPAGMFPNVGTRAVDIDLFPNLEGVVDVIYNPLRTNLVLDAQKKGIKAQGGLYMLAGQAVAACGHFLGREMNMSDVDKTYKNVLKGRRNIILTGMPGCGKSTVGRIVAKRLGIGSADTDEIIKKNIGMEISDYFKKYDESAFRDRESEAIESLGSAAGMVIATGGGAVLRDDNIRSLKRNGIVVFIDRPLEALTATSDRPLSSSVQSLKKRYEERIDIYRGTADIIIDAGCSKDKVASRLIAAVAEKI